MKLTKKVRNEFSQENPVLQSFHTGLWGFERQYDCLDLSRCTFKTEHGAKCGRARYLKELILDENENAKEDAKAYGV